MKSTIKILNIWLVLLLFINLSFAQVGINTTSPTEDLDVNGSLRVRSLNQGIVVSDYYGVLSVSNLIKSVAGHNNWSGVLVGGKSTMLFFAGRSATVATDVAFIVHYDPNAGSFSVISNSNCTVTNLGASDGNNGRLRVNVGGNDYDLTFVNAGNLSTITNSLDWFQGTFFSVTHNT